MIDVNKITSTLAKLPDAQLQQYAQMHKTDPYIMALAMTESNRRKEIRAAGQGAQGMQEQPKVVDQELAQMGPQQLPEEQGIGRIPAGEMNFAGGGIVAFADGGDIPHYNGDDESLVGFEEGKPHRLANVASMYPGLVYAATAPWVETQKAIYKPGTTAGEALARRAATTGVLAAVPVGGVIASNYAADQMRHMTPEQRRGFYDNPMLGAMGDTNALGAAIMNAPGMTPAKPSGYGPLKALGALIGYESTEDMQRRTAGERARAAAKAAEKGSATATDKAATDKTTAAATDKTTAAAAAATDKVTAGNTGRTGAGNLGAGPGAGSRASAGLPTYDSLDPRTLFGKSMETLGKETRPEKDMIEKINAEKEAAAKEEKTGLEALQAKFADAYKGRRERLDKSESELGERKDQNFGLALLQAGAAMMSTPGGIGAAIGKGIESGSRQYVAGMDKLNAAKDKLADARDKLDDLELNRNEMSAREILKAENNIRNTAISGKENMVKYIMDRDKVDRETALKLVDGQIKLGITQIEQAGANARAATAAAAANRNPQLELLQAVQKDPRLAATYQAMHGTKNDLMDQYNDFVGKNPGGTVEDFLKTKAAFSTLSGMLRAPVANPPSGAIAPRAP